MSLEDTDLPQEVMARRPQKLSVRATPLCLEAQAAELGSKSSLLASDPVPARLGLHWSTTEGTILESWLSIRPSLCIPQGTAPLPTRSQAERLERFSVGVQRGCVRFPSIHFRAEKQRRKKGSACRVPGSKCSGPLRSASSSPVLGPHGLATARDAASVRTSPAVPEPARLAAAAAAAGRGASGLPAPAPPAASVRSPSPRRWCAPSSRLRWKPPTEVSVPRATGAEERAATPRSPGRATGQLRLPSCTQGSPLKRGWRLPFAHAC